MRLALLALAVALLAPGTGAAEPKTYQEIQIPWPTAAQWSFIASKPDLEPMKIVKDVSVRYLSTPALTEELRAAGLHPDVIWPDLHAHYVSQALGGGYGSLYTWSEAVAFLDSLHAAHPGITTPKFSIGTTVEGRPIWAMKISDDAGLDEDEPEVYFDAVHHAREPISLSVVLSYMAWLCDGYGSDPEATFLVNQREIYVVPLVNPDGYVYNETTDPGGGGLWRKNRRDNPGTCEGVDNNRNYGYQWGGAGSSSDPCDETYRGTAAWSEPETQAVRDFVSARHFVTSDSYHSVAALCLYPWGYTLTPPPDSALFAGIGAVRTQDNGYVFGSCGPTLYLASGGAFDWMYGDTVMKPRVYGFTTEVGGSGFWPTEPEIPGLIAENLSSNIYLSEIAGAFVASTAVSVTGENGNGRLDPGETADLVVTMKNHGLIATAANVHVTLTSADPYVQLVAASSSFGTLAPGVSATNGGSPFRVTVDPATPGGYEAMFDLVVTWDGDGLNHDLVTLVVGTKPVLVSDNFETGNHGWTQDPTHTAATGAWVIIDPNPTDYQPGDDTTPAPGVNAWITAQNTTRTLDDVDAGISAIRSPVWNLSSAAHVRMSLNYVFGQLQAGGDAGDFFRIDLSNNGGATFPANLLLLGDVSSAPDWHSLVVDLEDYLPITNQMLIRFQASDRAPLADIVEGGFDDLLIVDNGSGNHVPAAPVNAFPPDGALVSTTPTITVTNATDADGDSLSYSFRVYSDPLLTTLVRSVNGIPGGAGQTSWTVSPALLPGTYWWRAYAKDAEVRGSFSHETSFAATSATGVSDAGASPALFAVSPANPNPFVSGTSIRFTLPATSPVRADLFDAKGRRIRSLYRGILPAGAHALTWDGRDERGEAASPGLYFVIVKTADRQETVKLTLVR